MSCFTVCGERKLFHKNLRMHPLIQADVAVKEVELDVFSYSSKMHFRNSSSM